VKKVKKKQESEEDEEEGQESGSEGCVCGIGVFRRENGGKREKRDIPAIVEIRGKLTGKAFA